MYLSGFGRHKPWDGTREEGLRLPSSFQLFPPTQAGPGFQALSSGHAPVGGRGEGPSIGVGQGQGFLCFPSSSAWHTICPGRTNLTRSRHSSPSEPNPSPSAPPKEAVSPPTLCPLHLLFLHPLLLSFFTELLLAQSISSTSSRHYPGFPNPGPACVSGSLTRPLVVHLADVCECLPDATTAQDAGEAEGSPPQSRPTRNSQLRRENVDMAPWMS